MIKKLRKLYYWLFAIYEETETKFTAYAEADTLLKATANLPDEQKWRLSKLEDTNTIRGRVWLCKRKRITE